MVDSKFVGNEISQPSLSPINIGQLKTVFALAIALTFVAGSSAKAEVRCLFLTMCDQDGRCEQVAKETDVPGTHISRSKKFNSFYKFEQDKGTVVVRDNQPESDAHTEDVIYMSKMDGSLAFFGQKNNHHSMISIGPDGTAIQSDHYFETGKALHFYGKCTGQY